MCDGICLYSGLDQLQAIREALLRCLNGTFSSNCDSGAAQRWIRDQGISEAPTDGNELTIWWAVTHTFDQAAGFHLEARVRRSAPPNPERFEIGAARSGASWKDSGRNFAITSAFIRLLGSEEQYEMDVLKALFYYRSTGLLGTEDEQMLLEAEESVLSEEPEGKVYTKPPVWTWLREQAENIRVRSNIFKNVFGISTMPEGYSPKGKPNLRDEWYKKRNAIAHGRSGVVMTLAEYVEVEVFVTKAMTFISEQCLEKLKLIV